MPILSPVGGQDAFVSRHAKPPRPVLHLAGGALARFIGHGDSIPTVAGIAGRFSKDVLAVEIAGAFLARDRREMYAGVALVVVVVRRRNPRD